MSAYRDDDDKGGPLIWMLCVALAMFLMWVIA
jgi:hypothetical protein